MSICLYHFTSRSDAAKIIASGFNDATCWLSPTPETVVGKAGRSALLEVVLDLSAAELEPFARNVTENEVWDEAEGDFIPDAVFSPTFVRYDVPVTMVEARGTIRWLTGDERARVMSGDLASAGDSIAGA